MYIAYVGINPESNPETLLEADLNDANLSRANLSRANLSKTYLRNVCLKPKFKRLHEIKPILGRIYDIENF